MRWQHKATKLMRGNWAQIVGKFVVSVGQNQECCGTGEAGAETWPCFYGDRMFITMFTEAHHRILS
jgi:hypothetical protein